MTQHLSARHINPEAGDHAVSADPVEQAAAEAAVRASWRESPYYPKRYGERGWRFSLSDTGWIQTLTQVTRAEARIQVRWLGGLLAARGMPMYLLERHLIHLHGELVKARPDQAARYQTLSSCADFLRDTRLAKIPQATFDELAQSFEERVRGCPRHVANMGYVIVAAVADERGGVANVVESLESWLCDPARFDATWVDAVKETIAAARRG